jgi:hypothetical protein
MAKSQADTLLNQLAREWEPEFDRLCTLLATSAVVHADETGWSINSVWAFLSEQVRIIMFGVHKVRHWRRYYQRSCSTERWSQLHRVGKGLHTLALAD